MIHIKNGCGTYNFGWRLLFSLAGPLLGLVAPIHQAFHHVQGIAPELIDIAATRFTQAGKELTNNAINQLIDIPKNRLKGVILDIEKKVRSMKDNTISKVIGKRNAIAQGLMRKLQYVID